MQPRIVIVDDHPLMCMAVRLVLEREGYDIVAECHTGADCVQTVRTLEPDLVVLDLSIPKLDGFSVIDRLRSSTIKTNILILTSSDSNHYAFRCLQAGASGFVRKDDKLEELTRAVKAVLAGYSYFQKEVTDQLRENAFITARKTTTTNPSELSLLTDRELTVFGLLVKGMNNQEIGNTLMLSHKTVSTYKIRLMSKLNAPNMVELVKIAQRNDIATT
ncbi:response regulator [Paenalcaligenes sp. Me131]|uniref:response regulator n=1 Tax=Paenalcaligenes sp. Me131 TaxID=3392636 RepID=UPI003D2CD947